MSKRLRIVAISDTHNMHDMVMVPDGDILIHAGDFTNQGTPEEIERFNAFLAELPHRYKVVIAGNHDFAFERTPEEARAMLTSCIYLQDEAVTIEGLKIYGSPWQPEFMDWAFNLPRGEPLREKWALIPEDTQVLVTHGPPAGHGDVLCSGLAVGCQDLREAVERVRPQLHIFGHIHEGHGITQNEYTSFINASSCDESYEPFNPPVVIELEAEE